MNGVEGAMRRKLLCLDLEGTLVSNAISQIPRPGLFGFLEQVNELCDLKIYTSVSKNRVNDIRRLLIDEGAAPRWFQDLDVIRPTGTLKPKSRCGRSDAFLLDDQEAVIKTDERQWWIPISEFLPPYSENDNALEHVLKKIKVRVSDE